MASIFLNFDFRLKRKKPVTTSNGDDDEEELESCPPRKKLKKKSNRNRILTAGSSSDEHDDEEIVILSQHKVVDSPIPKTIKSEDETTEKSIRLEEKTSNEKSRIPNLCLRDSVGNSEQSKHLPKERNSQNSSAEKSKSVDAVEALPSTSRDNNCSTTSGRSSTQLEIPGKRTILIGATEVHRANDLISDLKHRHNFDVVVRSGLNVGFLLSPRYNYYKHLLIYSKNLQVRHALGPILQQKYTMLYCVSDNQLYWLPIKVHFAIALLLNYYKLVRFWLDRLHSSV